MPTALMISSLVMRGAVGLRPGVFALERRGITVIAAPTVILPWHPGLGPSTRTVTTDLPRQLDELGRFAAAIDAVVTGYFADAAQVAAAARLITAVRNASPSALIVVDPVTGDENGRYVPDAVADAIVASLLPIADLATPNANELRDLGKSDDAITAARNLGPPDVVVTSAFASEGRTGAIWIADKPKLTVDHAAIHPAPRGTGDLFTAMVVAGRLDGLPEDEAIIEAAAATVGVIARSSADALALAEAQHAIARPDRSLVSAR